MPAQSGVSADAWPTIEPGALRHQIQIRQQSSAQDAANQPQGAWDVVRQCWAGMNLVGMREAFGGNQLAAQSTDIWTIRWSASSVIQPGMQVLFGNSTYRVQAVSNPGKRNIYLHLLCLELNATS